MGSAKEVHRMPGPGLLESAYEECLDYELLKKRLIVESQKPVFVTSCPFVPPSCLFV
ncbi:MAG: GxxExxY protein [Bacteroidetes bacterium]|nr:GxxExxY protein [Bacteroidota bacterium]